MIYYIYNYTEDAVKIGYAKSMRNVWLRYEGLQTGSATTLILLKIEEGDQKDEYQKHQQFANLWIRGEWFRYEGKLVTYIESDIKIDRQNLDKLTDDYIAKYHAKKYNRNLKMSYMKVKYCSDSVFENMKKEKKKQSEINEQRQKDIMYFVYENVEKHDDNETIKNKIKHYAKSHTFDLERTKQYFVESPDHLLTVPEIKDYLKQHRILNKGNTGPLAVSKLATYFNKEFVYRKINNKTVRCLSGLDFVKEFVK